MPPRFGPSANTIFRFVLLGIVLSVTILAWASGMIVRSPYENYQNVPREQPVPFSHEHHAGGLGLDCRYCHTSVETSSFAGIPPTKVCMNCHSQMWATAPALEPVRDSYRTGLSIEWTRVNDLPDFVYFNHSIHVAKGVGCATCHGRVDKMALTWRAQPLTMEWCLNCHRHPERYLRPQAAVFQMDYAPPPNQIVMGTQLMKDYNVERLTSCSTCHR